MRRLFRLTALCLAFVLMCAPALAGAPFLRHAEGWSMEGVPLEATLSADVTTHMPYDDDRMAMLQPVINNLSLRLSAGEDGGSVTILVGQSEALTLSYRGNAAQVSSIPETAFTSAGDPVSRLLGSAPTEMSMYGLRSDAETLLDDGWVLLDALTPALEEYGKRKSVKTSIADMGTARSCTDYTIPKDDAEALKETLLSLCPEGWLKEIISGLTFSGKQTLRVYRTADEVPLRMEYNGTCGPEGNLRTVKLVWRMRRDDTAHRDEVTLTSPAKSGTNKNTLEFERVIRTNKAGAVEMDASFTYTVTLDKKTTTLKGTADLTNAYTDEADVVTGKVTLQQKLPGESVFSGITLAPDLMISGSQDAPLISGNIGVSELSGKNVLEAATVYLLLRRGGDAAWEAPGSTVDLDAMSADELSALQQKVMAGAATALVKPLIILMGDSADWFFRDMSPDAVQQIIDAADSVVVLE